MRLMPDNIVQCAAIKRGMQNMNHERPFMNTFDEDHVNVNDTLR